MRKKRQVTIAMTIAGSDPSGGAGFQADLKTFAALDVYGYSVITSVIAQNSARVDRVDAVAAGMVAAQIRMLAEERRPGALKTGALANAGVVGAVADAIGALELPAPVVDPVLISSSGMRLLDEAGERALKSRLLSLARVVTPNVPEAEILAGITIDGMPAMRAAARAIRSATGVRAVVIKGGHALKCGDRDGARGTRAQMRARSPRTSAAAALEAQALDLLFDGRQFIALSAARVAGGGAHGTGCAFSAAIAAYLARGESLEGAVRHAKAFVTRALKNAFAIGTGRPVLDHFARR